MIRDLGVESRRQRRSGWYRRILGVIEQYKQNVVENLIPLIIEDFSGSISVKMKGGKMDDKEVEKLKEFRDKVNKSDDREYRDLLKTGLKRVKEWEEEELKEILGKIDNHQYQATRSYEYYDYSWAKVEKYILH